MTNGATFSFAYWSIKWCALLAEPLLWCASLILFYKWLVNRKLVKMPILKLPSLRLPIFSPLGHLGMFPSESMMKRMSLSLPAYALQFLSGNAAIFRQYHMFALLFPLKTGVLLIKQESVEELLTSKTVLEKSSFYKLSRDWLGTGLLTSHGSKWKSRRKLLAPAFHADILRGFMPSFDEQSKILVDILKNRVHEDWIDIVEPIALCSLDIICETMLGAQVRAQTDSHSTYVATLLRVSKALVERAVSPTLHPDITFRLSKLGRQHRSDVDCLHNFARKVIQEKKQALKSKASQCEEGPTQENSSHSKMRRKVFMHLLLDVHMNNETEFTEEDIREEVDTFVFEGHDTTSMGMSWALYLIGLYPDIQAKIYQELEEIFGQDKERPVTLEDLSHMQYLERVIKESLRLYPPVSLFGRQSHEDFSICGYKIKKGSEVAVLAYELHRNPEAFPNPERFDPDRFLPENSVHRHPFAYVPFSAGPRNCIGQRFAMMEQKVVISNVLRNFQVKSLQTRDEIHPVFDIILRPGGPLKLKLSLRTSVP